MTKEKTNVYQIVTDRIITELEKGNIPWERPWTGRRDGAYSRATGKPYSILNQLLLSPGEYATYKQIQEAGGQVRKGEKSSIVVFWKWIDIKDEETNEEKKIPLLRYYNVFHIDQCDNIDKKWDDEDLKPVNPIAEAEQFADEYLERENISLVHKDLNSAYFSPTRDIINIPLIDQFSSANEYYATLFHEVTHSTGAASRLNRIKGSAVAAFGSQDYSKEELVAEIGSATIMSMMGLEIPKTFNNSVAYLQSWIKALKNDNRLIVSAAGQAQKAIALITGEVTK